MNILVVGKGGREHAIIQSLRQSQSVEQIYSLPGRHHFESISITPQKVDSLIPFLKEKKVTLVVIGPEQELVDGWSDDLRSNGFLVFGPSRQTALLEGSKIFAKQFMESGGIPTSRYAIVKNVSETLEKARQFSPPYVLKADGLAGGKGVFICKNIEELTQHAKNLFEKKSLGLAGSTALLEEFQEGYELSVFILTNGEDYRTLPLAQDYKKRNNHHQGPNTGGMGSVAPISIDSSLEKNIHSQILKPTVKQLKKQNLFYRGVLYVGLIVTKNNIKVLEYNVRFGDPECQVLLPLIKNNMADLFYSIAQGILPDIHLQSLYSCCVVLAEKGYPDHPKKGLPIEGSLHTDDSNAYWLHAGTKKTHEGEIVTDGGRVLNAMGVGHSLTEARKKAYQLIEKNQSSLFHYRTDIGS